MTHAAAPTRHCDLLIVGAGPAGMAAACAAAASGARIVLVDDNPAPGGQIWRDGPAQPLPAPARVWRERLQRLAHVQLRSGTRVAGLGDAAGTGNGRSLLLEDADCGWTQTFERLLLCTGARELLLPFPGWTLPGVTGAGGLQALVKGGLPVAGQRIVVAGSGPLLLAAAATARRGGAEVLRIAEQAPWSALATFTLGLARWPGKAAQAAALVDRRWRAGSHVLQAHGTERLHAVTLRTRSGGTEHIDCDRLACGFGLVPNVQLGQLLGTALDARGGIATDALQQTTLPGVYAAGECTGIGGSERALAQGTIAGCAAMNAPVAPRLQRELARWQAFAQAVHGAFTLSPALRTLPRPDTLLCRCEDVPHAAVQACAGWVDAKLHTRCGMGACQGRVCGAASQFLFGWELPAPRHLLSPVRIATLAGVEPRRNTDR